MEASVDSTQAQAGQVQASYSLWQLIAYMLKLGACGFGGPVALVGYMHRDLVERRQWIGEADYKEGLTLSQMAPGPMAAQLAIYLGYVHYKVLGATLSGLAFVLPSFLMVLGIGWAYVHFDGLPWMQAVFYGVGAAVIGIITLSARKLTQKCIGKDKLLWAIYLLLLAVTVVTKSEVALLFIASGVLVWLWRCPPQAWKRGKLMSAAAVIPVMSATQSGTLVQMALFFAKAGAFVFGSGLAIVPFLYGGVVHEHHWLTERQFVDAVAVAMITPGPDCHYGRFYRLPDCRGEGRCCCRARDIPALLPVHHHPRSLYEEVWQSAGAPRVCGWRDSRRRGSHYGIGYRAGAAFHCRCSDGCAGYCHLRATVEV